MPGLIKHRIYGSYPTTNVSTLTASPGSPKTLAHHVAPGGTSDTFLRLRAQFQLAVQVSDVTPPPEYWWTGCSATLMAWWTPSASTALGAANGTSEHYLGSKVLAPTTVLSPTTPGVYTVLWRMTEDLICETARKDAAATAGPSVNLGLVVYDTGPYLTGIYSIASIDYEARLFTLWGTPP